MGISRRMWTVSSASHRSCASCVRRWRDAWMRRLRDTRTSVRVSKLVHGLEAYGNLIVGHTGAGRSRKERSVLDEDAGVRFITAHLSAQFDEFCGQVRERQRCLLPFLNDAGAVAVLVVEVLGAHREPPLIVDLIIDVARRAIPLRLDRGSVDERGEILLLAPIDVQNERELAVRVVGAHRIDQAANSVCAGADEPAPGELLNAAVALDCQGERLVGRERYAELGSLLFIRILQLIPAVVDADDNGYLIGCGIGEPRSRV